MLLTFAIITIVLTEGSSVLGASHVPIHINGDSGYNSTNGVVSGDGSEADPYVIADWEIYTTSGHSIKVEQTTKHFILRNITITCPDSTDYSIYLYSTKGSALLENITIMEGGWTSLRAQSATNLTVKNFTMDPIRSMLFSSCRGLALWNVELSWMQINYCSDGRVVGCNLTGSYGTGIYSYDCKNLTFLNCSSRGSAYGMEVWQGRRITIEGCELSGNTVLDLYLHARDTLLRDNTFGRRGVQIPLWYQDIDSSNTVGGLPLRYHTNETDVRLDSPSGQIILKDCRNFTVANITMDGPYYCVYLDGVSHSTFTNLTLSAYAVAFKAGRGENLTIRDSVMTTEDQDEGYYTVEIKGTRNATVEGSIIVNGTLASLTIGGTLGTNLHSTFRLVNTTVSNSDRYGIEMRYFDSADIEVIDCWIHNTTDDGFSIGDSFRTDWANLTIENTSFTDVRTTGVAVATECNLRVMNSTFFKVGDAIYLYRSGDAGTALIEGCHFQQIEGVTTLLPGTIIRDNTFVDFQEGIYFKGLGSVSDGNTLRNGVTGVVMDGADLVIKNTTIENCTSRGIALRWFDDSAKRFLVYNCTIKNSFYGVNIEEAAAGSQIDNCTISECNTGIRLDTQDGILVTWNEITECSLGITIGQGSAHVFHHNVLVRNNYNAIPGTYQSKQASDASSSGNQWDDGSEGNYWADYTQWYPNAKVSGRIWDTPYELSGRAGSTDRFPLAVKPDAIPPIAHAGEDQTVGQNTSVGFDGTGCWDNIGITRYEWSFMYGGNPKTVTGQNPWFMFDLPGIYNVTLTVRDAWGFIATDVVNISVLDTQPPTANGGPDVTVDMGEEVRLSALSSWDNVGIVGHSWSVDPEGLDLEFDGPFANFTIDDPGDYQAILTALDAVGNRGNDTVTVHVLDIIPPQAEAGPDTEVDQGTEVKLNATGSTDNIAIDQWTWTFENEGRVVSLSGEVADFTFDTPGTYNVTLRVSDVYGLTDEDYVMVTVRDIQAPYVSVGPDVVVDQGALVVLDGRGSSDNVAIASYTWTFEHAGSKVVLEEAMTEFTYLEAGTYLVTLEVADMAGNVANDTLTVTVRDTTPPLAVAGADVTIDQHETISFDATASQDNTVVDTFLWTFDHEGEPIQLKDATTEFTFDEAGVFEITLTVSDAAGNEAIDHLTVTVIDITPPIPDAGQDWTIDQGQEAEFDGSMSTDNVGVTKWMWTFHYMGEDHSMDMLRARFLFSEPAAVEVTLTVEDEAGNAANTTFTVFVRDITPPSADGGDDVTLFVGDTATFDGSNSTDNVGVVRWTWSFTYGGSPEELDGPNTRYTFTKPGTYEVILEVEDATGSGASDTILVVVKRREMGDGASSLAYVLLIVVILVTVLAVVYWRNSRG